MPWDMLHARARAHLIGSRYVPANRSCVQIGAAGTDGWTEWFAAANFDKAVVHSKNYSRALEAVDRWIESADGVPQVCAVTVL